MRKNVFFVLLSLIQLTGNAQSIGQWLPRNINPRESFVFYLHGGVVTVLGNNGINRSVPEWGPYEYLNILDTLRSKGFNVISENRKPEVEDSVYALRVAAQVDTLLKRNVPPKNILVLGASAGWHIALLSSAHLRNDQLKVVVMGGCWPETYKDYESLPLFGKFLSIIEASDPHGTCVNVFEGRKNLTSFREITLHTGLSHGFIYKGHKAWVDPVVQWFRAE